MGRPGQICTISVFSRQYFAHGRPVANAEGLPGATMICPQDGALPDAGAELGNWCIICPANRHDQQPPLGDPDDPWVAANVRCRSGTRSPCWVRRGGGDGAKASNQSVTAIRRQRAIHACSNNKAESRYCGHTRSYECGYYSVAENDCGCDNGDDVISGRVIMFVLVFGHSVCSRFSIDPGTTWPTRSRHER